MLLLDCVSVSVPLASCLSWKVLCLLQRPVVEAREQKQGQGQGVDEGMQEEYRFDDETYNVVMA
jgi:hypothetical protein